MADSCCLTLSKIILIAINVLVSILALFFLALGVMMAAAQSLMADVIWPQLRSMLANGGDSEAVVDLSALFDKDLDLLGKLSTVAIPMIVVSVILVVISFLGCCGVCCKNKVMVGVYAFVMSLLVIGVIGGAAYYYVKSDDIMNRSEDALEKIVRQNFVNETNRDITSMVFTALQTDHSCCGASGGVDYDGSTVLYRKYGNATYQQKIPISCCNDWRNKDDQQLSECTTVRYNNDNYSNYNLGCFSVIKGTIKQYTMYLLIAVVGGMVFVAALAISGWIVFVHLHRRSSDDKPV